jgi:GNAT superfamily N-acetyltransferase
MREVKTDQGSFFVNAPDVSDWTKITHTEDKKGNRYEVHDNDTGDLIGSLQYLRDRPLPRWLTILTMGVVAGYQHRGVGKALLQQLRIDHPDYYIDPGVTTLQGLEFCRHVLATEPEAVVAKAPTYKEKSVGY